MSQGWYSIHARGARDAEIWIYGDIGESWSDETVPARQFVADLAKINPLTPSRRIRPAKSS